ncbi:hypothetical protein BS78_02G029500 [Paspalum vaginatum]|nr:hypothetical protein BS78_02G029500 [Paspalum vaginatum]
MPPPRSHPRACTSLHPQSPQSSCLRRDGGGRLSAECRSREADRARCGGMTGNVFRGGRETRRELPAAPLSTSRSAPLRPRCILVAQTLAVVRIHPIWGRAVHWLRGRALAPDSWRVPSSPLPSHGLPSLRPLVSEQTTRAKPQPAPVGICCRSRRREPRSHYGSRRRRMSPPTYSKILMLDGDSGYSEG